LAPHPIGHAVIVALLALPLQARAQTPLPAAGPPEVLHVSRTDDDSGEGSLRWAVERNNAAPGRFRIEIAPMGPPPHVIKLTAPLPPIKGPVAIEGMPWKSSGEFIVLDGAGYIVDKGHETCPGAVPGHFGTNVRTTTGPGLAVVDTQGVDISGLDIRNFCIGVLIHRASGNVVHDNRIVGNRGGAGVMLTGDDGSGSPTATTTVHNKVLRNEFVDNGDGLELTRGAAFNLIANNTFRSTPANPEPSQGIEILGGHDNVLLGNRFEGYSDGIQVNAGNRNYLAGNTFTGNTFGLSLSGTDNVVERNTIEGNAVGIAVRPAAPTTVARISRNAISGNGQAIERCFAGGSCDPNLPKGGIVFGLPSGEHASYVGKRGIGVNPLPVSLAKICPDGAPNCQGPPNGSVAAPVIESVRRNGTRLTVQGRVTGEARARFTVEIFANRLPGSGEGELYLGDVVTMSDAAGNGVFSFVVDAARVGAMPATFTATLTSSRDGATSEFSKPVGVSE
jgi:3-dehydroshikimate dehydratase